MMKRVFLFLLTNLAVIVVASIVLSLLGVKPYLNAQGINYGALLAFAAVFGFTGSFVSLMLSKFMAKRVYNIHIINQPRNRMEDWLSQKVQDLSAQMGIGTPEIGVYASHEPNAFATGWNRNKALVAVSTGLMETMSEEEVEAVLAHEVGHVANGDMITLTLIQGVVNTFVIFFARIAAWVVTNFLAGDRDEEGGGFPYLIYFIVSIFFEIVFGILASVVVMWFSRYREYRADAASAKIVGAHKMIAALRRLQHMSKIPVDSRAPEMSAFKINNRGKFLALFSSHPPLEKRIAALQNA